MGAKDVSKKIMIEHGVPVVPGFQGEAQDEQLLFEQVGRGFLGLVGWGFLGSFC